MLALTEMIYSPDRASPENNWTNENYTRLTSTCSAGDWSYIYERKSSEYNRIEAEAEITKAFNSHKADCPLTKFQELYKQAGTTAAKVAVIAKHLGLLEA